MLYIAASPVPRTGLDWSKSKKKNCWKLIIANVYCMPSTLLWTHFFKCHNNLMKLLILLFTLHRGKSWGSERWCDLPKITQLVVGFESRSFDSRIQLWANLNKRIEVHVFISKKLSSLTIPSLFSHLPGLPLFFGTGRDWVGAPLFQGYRVANCIQNHGQRPATL